MKRAWLGLGAAVILAAAFACGDDGGGGAGGGGDGGADATTVPDASSDVTTSGDGGDAATGPVPAPFGLDARPPNPTCTAKDRPKPNGRTYTLVEAYPSLPDITLPVQMSFAPGDTSKVYVAQQEAPYGSGGSTIKVFANDAAVTTTKDFLVIPPGQIYDGGESGLLAFAFDPGWQVNHTVYVAYTIGPPEVRLANVLARLKSTDGGATVSWASREILMDIEKLAVNHNFCAIAFGPDGYLYLATGDGGGANDGFGNGQNMDTLLAKFLRIKVGPTGPYTIPPDNPYVAGGGKPEIWATGFRNPWHWSFDRATGELWAGDVGQNTYEEIDIVQKGGNYGWPIREGAHCSPFNPPGCSSAGLVDPVFDYDHSVGQSITGGYVYRGKKFPELVGTYVFGDFATGHVYALERDPATGAASMRDLVPVLPDGLLISNFTEDVDGELYVVNWNGARIYRLEPGTPAGTDTFPGKLSDTGCFEKADPKKPVAAMIPFAPTAELWSDGADKSRWMALPDGKTIDLQADGDFDFPIGTVLAKEFRLGGKRVETRLFMRHADGGWGGYSYEWNDAETDATLLPAGKTKAVGAQSWSYPSRTQCMQCHTAAAGRALGPEVRQLNADFVYTATNRISNQLATLDHVGLFTAPLGDPKARPSMPAPHGAGPVEDRARAYLHGNCSFCHRPGGTGRGPEDFRFGATPAEVGACGAAPTQGDLGVAGAKLLAPGDPAKSVLSLRMKATDVRRMPPVGTRVVDPKGTALVDDWIRAKTTCP